MKEAIRMVPEFIYDPEFPRHIALPLAKCFHTIDPRPINLHLEGRDRRFQVLLLHSETVFFRANRKRWEGPPDSVPHSVLLSALLGNIYLHKLDQEIGRIRQKHEIPLVQRIRSVLLRTGRRIDDQEKSGEEASFNAPQDNRAIIVGRGKEHPTQTNLSFPSSLAAFLNKPSSLLCTAFLIEAAGLTPKAEFSGRKGHLREARSSAGPLSKHSFLIRIFDARYADDLLLGIVGAVFILIEIQKRITHFLQSGLKGSAGSTTIAARSKVEFLGTVIREVPPRTTPRKFLRELEKRLRVKHRIHITACHLRSAIHSKFRDLGNSIPIKELTKGMSGRGRLLDAVQLADTLGKEGLRSTQVSVFWGTVKHIRQGARAISLLHSSGRSKVPPDNREYPRMNVFSKRIGDPRGPEGGGERQGKLGGIFQQRIPHTDRGTYKKDTRRLRDRGIISRRRPRPIHVASLTNVSDGDIVNRSAGIAISPLSYYRCCDNLYQVRTIVDYQIRWAAIKTLAHKHKSSARHIIPKYPKDLNIFSGTSARTPSSSWTSTSGLITFIHQLVYQLGELWNGSPQGRVPLPLGGLAQETAPPTGGGRGNSNAPLLMMLQPGGADGANQLPDLNAPAPEVVALEEHRETTINEIKKRFAYLWGADLPAVKDQIFPLWHVMGGGGFVKGQPKPFLPRVYLRLPRPTGSTRLPERATGGKESGHAGFFHLSFLERNVA
ncbi:hypothetical protein LUZ61_023091 [Rhynchospora tenuis]|uniref:Domain X domain-containing protein n=1 Tax=Rhynchospora tenuis TaxID=198213 RepID=A0AAD5W342_9POAL|nr:hypothetical protein LUZ61_023091 [Rhynchospora tenuis]